MRVGDCVLHHFLVKGPEHGLQEALQVDTPIQHAILTCAI